MSKRTLFWYFQIIVNNSPLLGTEITPLDASGNEPNDTVFGMKKCEAVQQKSGGNEVSQNQWRAL
jgi:hypothetical protein